jgi:hypothetical protein
MNSLSTKGRALAAAGVVGAASMLGLATATAASATTVSAPSTQVASASLQTSLQTIIWHPPYGCFVCGLGGYDPPIFGDPIMTAGQAAF